MLKLDFSLKKNRLIEIYLFFRQYTDDISKYVKLVNILKSNNLQIVHFVSHGLR